MQGVDKCDQAPYCPGPMHPQVPRYSRIRMVMRPVDTFVYRQFPRMGLSGYSGHFGVTSLSPGRIGVADRGGQSQPFYELPLQNPHTEDPHHFVV
jgi:hypothetical protein